MKTIIHIGQHKTGTTSIQRFLSDNRYSLIESGLYVPQGIAGFNHPSHSILNVYALAEDRFSSTKERIILEKGASYLNTLEPELIQDIETIYREAKQQNCDKVLWSNEGLYLLNTIVEYQKLKSLFKKHSKEVEVVCCFREVESYRKSYTKQLQKQKIKPSQNPDSYRYLNSDSWLFDYSNKKKLLSAVFDRCVFFEYDSADNINKFLDATQLNIIANQLETSKYTLNKTKNRHGNLLHRVKESCVNFFQR